MNTLAAMLNKQQQHHEQLHHQQLQHHNYHHNHLHQQQQQQQEQKQQERKQEQGKEQQQGQQESEVQQDQQPQQQQQQQKVTLLDKYCALLVSHCQQLHEILQQQQQQPEATSIKMAAGVDEQVTDLAEPIASTLRVFALHSEYSGHFFDMMRLELRAALSQDAGERLQLMQYRQVTHLLKDVCLRSKAMSHDVIKGSRELVKAFKVRQKLEERRRSGSALSRVRDLAMAPIRRRSLSRSSRLTTAASSETVAVPEPEQAKPPLPSAVQSSNLLSLERSPRARSMQKAAKKVSTTAAPEEQKEPAPPRRSSSLRSVQKIQEQLEPQLPQPRHETLQCCLDDQIRHLQSTENLVKQALPTERHQFVRPLISHPHQQQHYQQQQQHYQQQPQHYQLHYQQLQQHYQQLQQHYQQRSQHNQQRPQHNQQQQPQHHHHQQQQQQQHQPTQPVLHSPKSASVSSEATAQLPSETSDSSNSLNEMAPTGKLKKEVSNKDRLLGKSTGQSQFDKDKPGFLSATSANPPVEFVTSAAVGDNLDCQNLATSSSLYQHASAATEMASASSIQKLRKLQTVSSRSGQLEAENPASEKHQQAMLRRKHRRRRATMGGGAACVANRRALAAIASRRGAFAVENRHGLFSDSSSDSDIREGSISCGGVNGDDESSRADRRAQPMCPDHAEVSTRPAAGCIRETAI